MDITIREYQESDLDAMLQIWNRIINVGIGFSQMSQMTKEEGRAFFAHETFTGVAEKEGEIIGVYVLHPNNIGRSGHICNAALGVKEGYRGMHIGERLLRHCMNKGHEKGFRILVFNAVVRTNYAAIRLYEKLHFTRIGTIPGGFLMRDGYYEDIYLYYSQI